MNIICTGHSGFLVSLPEIHLIFDYYTDNADIIVPETFANKKTYVFVSHGHHDHYNQAIFDWNAHGDITYILDSECAAPIHSNIIKMREGEGISLHEGTINVRAYGSTDEGLSFLVKAGDVTLFHAGDLNDWYWEDDFAPDRLRLAEDNYLRIIKQLEGTHIDVAFVPEDPRLGKHTSRAVDHFKAIVKPKHIIPMHFPGNEGAVSL
ncbi:MAG: MBL fold metallo-hydrolase [Defluviitaleaceae bacterium]|nr:MBL fold metallo-hydrolase [Defluviitaleaceae bacterium]